MNTTEESITFDGVAAEEYTMILRVTSSDFNGTSFDGSPFEVIFCSPTFRVDEILGTLFLEDEIVLNEHGETTYARWNVSTPEGLTIAEPGDYITYRDGALKVIAGGVTK